MLPRVRYGGCVGELVGGHTAGHQRRALVGARGAAALEREGLLLQLVLQLVLLHGAGEGGAGEPRHGRRERSPLRIAKGAGWGKRRVRAV